MSETSPSSPEIPKSPESWLSRLGSSFSKAFEKAKKEKDAGWLDKIKIFFTSFWEEMTKVEKEKVAVTKETRGAVAVGIDETMGAAMEEAHLSENVTKDDRAFYAEMLATTVKNLKSLEANQQVYAIDGLEKIKKTSKGEEQNPLTFDEAQAISALGLMTLDNLREKYPNKSDFKTALDRFKKISDETDYPLSKLLRREVFALFKVDAGMRDIGKVNKLLGALEIDLSEAMYAKKLFAGLKKDPIEHEEELVKFMKENIFTYTSEGNIAQALDIIHNIVIQDTVEIDTQMLTDLVFCINEEDYDTLVRALLGKKMTSTTVALGDSD